MENLKHKKVGYEIWVLHKDGQIIRKDFFKTKKEANLNVEKFKKISGSKEYKYLVVTKWKGIDNSKVNRILK